MRKYWFNVLNQLKIAFDSAGILRLKKTNRCIKILASSDIWLIVWQYEWSFQFDIELQIEIYKSLWFLQWVDFVDGLPVLQIEKTCTVNYKYREVWWLGHKLKVCLKKIRTNKTNSSHTPFYFLQNSFEYV